MVKEKEVRTRCNGGIMEGAPDWYDTPLDELDFEWSPEEKLEIERYCEKIHKNISESGDEMTPKERYQATIAGKPKDRQLISLAPGNNYLSRVLDSGADAIKTNDIIRNPKLFVKAQLAFLARFAPDWPMYMIICYSGLGLFGGRAKTTEYGQPVMVESPIKSLADLEGLEVPDPMKDGMFPGYLWSCREMKRIFDDYGLSKVMAIYSSMCPGVEVVLAESMMGMSPFIIALRKDPELCKRAAVLAQEFSISLGKAIIEVSRPEIIQC